jgi:8-oxo-dGTP pyrophosphatase MutT (NUDIX family)
MVSLEMHDTGNPWTILGSRDVYENPWISLTEFDVINPAGGRGIYGKVHFRNLAVGIAALDADGRLWLVGQYRFTIDAYSWEIPEGGCPEGTDPLESAKRELKEETGLEAASWERIAVIHLSNSVTDELGIVWLATGLTEGEPSPEDTERISIRKIPLEEAWRMVETHQITDSLSVAAIQQLWIRRLQKIEPNP